MDPHPRMQQIEITSIRSQKSLIRLPVFDTKQVAVTVPEHLKKKKNLFQRINTNYFDFFVKSILVYHFFQKLKLLGGRPIVVLYFNMYQTVIRCTTIVSSPNK